MKGYGSMDLFPQYAAAIKKILVRLLGIAILAGVIGLIWVGENSPKVPPESTDYVSVTLQYVCMPIGDFIVSDPQEESAYRGEFKECFIVNSIKEGKNLYLISPFTGFDLNRLDGLHEMTTFPIFTLTQAQSLAKAKQGIIRTEGGTQFFEVELGIPKDLWGEFIKGFIKQETKEQTSESK